ncbi:Putative major facilitator superfamily, MFS transporter superfamily [Colletotrichum destructivum]|uniref:Major facilitator superfamily, MFS transporter superfamily n=1 Tax=Colletotrichum destructivum TaxID=34406 RepID=A0AAX4IQK9_9PEZI|nr:Putative major facilitator superfamily, MFS transporter superfamily [Colletotrichum destructivum]
MAQDKTEVPVKEAGEHPAHTKIPYWRIVYDQAGITPEVAAYPYPGSGTEADPFLVQWIPHDPRNPMLFSKTTKWFITMMVSLTTLAVALLSSAYTGGIRQIIEEFGVSQEVATLGVSLFVLGFAIGPLLWAPLSELFGRQSLFFGTYAVLTAFNAGCAGADSATTLLVLRFFAGAFGSSPLANSGGVIADLFPAAERGLAMALFAAAPFLGPVLGPIIGGFLGAAAGWRWVMGFLAAFSGTFWLLGTALVPETYAPYLLRQRAAKLSKMTGKCYVSKIEHEQGKISLAESFKTALSRPWILLFREPIVLLLSLYMAIIYGTMYMLFAAFPIVYQQGRGWSQGIGGLAFLGIMVGMIFAIMYTIPENSRYQRVQEENGGFAPPETRLRSAMVGSVAVPVGLFWFAWTNNPSIHWIVSIAAGIPFGFGMVLLFLSTMNYLIDSYTIFAASVLAASSVIRSCFGAAFPLFTSYMYEDLGTNWASSIPAFLALACVPFPFLFYKYGPAIRARCKFAAESEAFMARLREGTASEKEPENSPATEAVSSDAADLPTSSDDDSSVRRQDTRRTMSIASTRRKSYDGNPYDIDRVHTRESFGVKKK